MPNWCDNSLSIKGPHDTLAKIHDLMRGEENAFDFEKIIPMPDYIFRGNVGPKEQELYGENNWYDWSCENWGTKWNSEDAHCEWFSDSLVYDFETAWSPCDPVIEALAKMFPDTKVFYRFSEPGCCFCGEREYENGKINYSMDGEYTEEFYVWDDEESIRLSEKYERGLFRDVKTISENDEASIYEVSYRDSDDERTITITGVVFDARAKKTGFGW